MSLISKAKSGLLLLLVFLLALGGSLAYFKPEYAEAVMVGLGAFTLLFGLLVFGKIKVER